VARIKIEKVEIDLLNNTLRVDLTFHDDVPIENTNARRTLVGGETHIFLAEPLGDLADARRHPLPSAWRADLVNLIQRIHADIRQYL